jgi:CBS domain-containing protein
VVSVQNTMDLRELAKLFLEKGITGAPVVDSAGDLQGVISQTDLVYYNLTRDDQLVMDSLFYQTARMEGRHVPRGFQIEDCNTGMVADVMTPVVHSVDETATLESVARLMSRKRIHRVIVRHGHKVAGIISALDVLRFQSKQRPVAKGKPAGKSKVARKTAKAAPKKKAKAVPKKKTKAKAAPKKKAKAVPKKKAKAKAAPKKKARPAAKKKVRKAVTKAKSGRKKSRSRR